jgi:hypothetical protein
MQGTGGNADGAGIPQQREREPGRGRDSGVGIRGMLSKRGDVAARADAASGEGRPRPRDGPPAFEQRVEECGFIAPRVLDTEDARKPCSVLGRNAGLLRAGWNRERAEEERRDATAPLPARGGSRVGSP